MAASGTAARIAYLGETTRGTTITGGLAQFIVQRAIRRNINLHKDPIESEESSQGRQRSDVRHGFQRIEGDIEVELQMETYNDWLLWGTNFTSWLAPATAAVNGSVTTLTISGTNTITRGGSSPGNWIDDGYRPGDWVRLTNFTSGANNGDFRVTFPVTATVLTLVGTLVNEAGAATAQVAYIGKKANVSNVLSGLKTFSLEREILDLDAAGIDLYQIFKGVGINKMAFSAKPDSMAKMIFSLLGMTGTINGSASADNNAVYTGAPTNSPLASIDGTVYIGGTQVNATEFNFLLDNQRTTLGLLGSRTTPDLFEGVAKATGSMRLLLSSITRLSTFATEGVEAGGFQIRLNELGTSDFMVFNFARVKYMTCDIDPPQNGPVDQQINFEALEQTFVGSAITFKETMSIQRSTST